MKIRIYSDIHLDHYVRGCDPTRVVASIRRGEADPFWYPPVLDDDKETTLILAGDLWEGTRFIKWGEFSWISEVAPRFRKVLVILGNHDYWPQGGLRIVGGADKCNRMLAEMGLENVEVLDESTYTDPDYPDYIFAGATLWTDFGRGDRLAMLRMNEVLSYDGKISYEVRGSSRRTFSAGLWLKTHQKHASFFSTVAKQNAGKKVIAISHHLPLLEAGDPQDATDPSNVYYMSDLSGLILDNPNIVFWTFGHTHYNCDFKFGSTRLFSNCAGYKHQYQEEIMRHQPIDLTDGLRP